jgi:transposase-like protein
VERRLLVSELREAGDQIQAICQVLGLSRASFYRWRRAWLKYREDLPVGYNRIYRLMKENQLLVPQKRYRAKRQPGGRKAVQEVVQVTPFPRRLPV